MAPARVVEEDSYPGIPAFPNSVPTAPLLRISLAKLLSEDAEEEERFWQACCGLGFFYLDLRMDEVEGYEIDGNQLLEEAESLFKLEQKFFALPEEEKLKYDFAEKGSYMGYKGYGAGIIDKAGTKDRNEFYNLSKDDFTEIGEHLPAPSVIEDNRNLVKSFMLGSNNIVQLVLGLLNERLGLPEGKLGSMHRLKAASGDQVRFIRAVPQPPGDRRVALGGHSDFGSVTVLFNRLGGLQVLLPDWVKPIPPSESAGDDMPANIGNEKEGEEWAYVRPLPGHAIINLGDAVVKFSAGILRSNIHRVASPPGKQGDETRYSLVYFNRPEDEVILKALEGSEMIDAALAKKGGRGDEPEINSRDWVLNRAFSTRQNPPKGYGEKGNYNLGTEEESMRRPTAQT